jgi:hypothetical protein
MVSYYFFLYFRLRESGIYVSHVAKKLPFHDCGDVRSNLPRFLEFMLDSPMQPWFSWQEFASQWWRRDGFRSVRYEDVKENPEGELHGLVRHLSGRELSPETLERVVAEFSFERQAGRAPGQEERTAFLRKGTIGDWREYFTVEARQIFNHYAGEELIRLGYETDDSWVATPIEGARAGVCS